MKDFKTADNSYKNGNMQYISKQERKYLEKIPEEALLAIKKFDSFNQKVQTQHAGPNELQVCNSIWSPNMKKTLLYALESGTAYTIHNGNIYIWYKPFKCYYGAGFYRLKRFVFLDGGSSVKYFLDGKDKIPNPL